jgi:PAS domain S-box-containing protein
LAKRTILIVDDNEINRKLLKAQLGAEGYRTIEAADGLQALELLRRARVDLVISDILMPRMDGYRMCYEIRKSKNWKNIPVIMYTATYTSPGDEKLALDAGADRYLPKPSSTKTLVEAIHDLTTGKTASQHKQVKKHSEAEILKEYNEVLVRKLEKKNVELHEANRRLNGQNRVLKMIAEGAPLRDTLDALLRTTEAQSADMLCSILLLDGDGVHMRHAAAPSLPEAYIRAIDGEPIGPSVGSCGTAAFRREQVIVEDIETDPLWENYRGVAAEHGLRACWSTPIFDAERRVLGTFALYFRSPGRPAERHRQLIDIATHTAAIAIGKRREEEALRASEERFRQLAENINEIFFVIKGDGSAVEYVSPAYENVFGKNREDLYRRAQDWLDAVHPDDRPRMQEAYASRPDRLKDEFRLVRPDGELRWLYARSFPVRGDTGTLVRVVGIAEDITERKRAEQKAGQNLDRIRALHEIDTAISSTLDLSTVLPVLLEKLELFLPIAAATTVRLLNRETGELESLACRGLDEAEWKSQERRLIGGRAKWIVETKAPLAVRDLQADRRTYYGEIFRRHGLVSYLGVPLTAQDEVLGVLGIYADHEHEFSQEEIEFLNTLAGQAAIAIHNAQLFEQTKKQAQALETSNRVKDEFLSVMSHEFRTPLSIIIGYTGLVKEGILGPVNNKIADALTKVLGRAGEQLTMINDIMQTTQIESRSIAVEHLPVDIGALMDALKSDYELHMYKPPVKLLWDYPAETIEIRSDGAKLKQILQNLVNNALKFTDAGTVTVTARVTGARDRGVGAGAGSRPLTPGPRFVEFKVADTGVGIPKDNLATIFDKFYQLDSSETRLYGGVGLGLYIVKNFTELLGGKIKVDSEEGKGSTFTVTLPARSAAPSGAYRLRG